MKVYGGEIKTGLRLLYNGEPIKWSNRSGKIVEILKRGKYVVSRVTRDFVYLKHDRAKATKEFQLHKEAFIEIYELEFADLTTTIGLIFNTHKTWYINNEELIKSAKKYNKAG